MYEVACAGEVRQRRNDPGTAAWGGAVTSPLACVFRQRIAPNPGTASARRLLLKDVI